MASSGSTSLAKGIAKALMRVLEVLLWPLTLVGALWLWVIRRSALTRAPLSRAILLKVGILPVRDHYYEPFVRASRLTRPLSDPRVLPGIDLSVTEQLAVLSRFDFNEELLQFPPHKQADQQFHYFNGAFGPGDAEYLYNIVRSYKPSRIVEIGSGYSTLMAAAAVVANRNDDPSYACEHLCVEPFEHPWLEGLGVTVTRDVVERVDRKIFSSLRAGDILFIDSSHVVKPQGDVVVEYLELLPALQPGTLVHVHDIFTPRDYPREWVIGEMRLWNEQYLLEAFLSFNTSFKVIGALNFLAKDFARELAEKCPIFAEQPKDSMEPGSFWMVRV